MNYSKMVLIPLELYNRLTSNQTSIQPIQQQQQQQPTEQLDIPRKKKRQRVNKKESKTMIRKVLNTMSKRQLKLLLR